MRALITLLGDAAAAAVAATLIFANCCLAQQQPTAASTNSVDLVVNTGVGGPLSMGLSPDGRFLAVPNGNQIELWDVQKGRLIRTFTGIRSGVSIVAMSRDGKQVATGTFEVGAAKIYVWDVETGRLAASLNVPAKSFGTGQPYAAINALAFTADGRRVIAAGSFNLRTAGRFKFATEVVRIIDISSGSVVRSIEAVDTSNAYAVEVSPDGRSFAVGFYGGVTRIYDIDGREIRSLRSSDNKGEVQTLALSPNGQFLALANSGSKKTDVEIWSVATGNLLHTLERDREDEGVGIAWSPDGEAIATRGGSGLRIWSARSGTLERENKTLGPSGHAVSYEPDGSSIITTDKTLVLVDAKTMQTIKLLGERVGRLIAGTAGGTDEVLLSVEPCSVYSFNVLTGSIKKRFARDNADELCPVYLASSDGRKFVDSQFIKTDPHFGSVPYADLSAGGNVKTLITNATGPALLSGDGRTVAVEVGKTIDILDTGSGAIRRSIPGKPSHLGFALSPDGKRLAAVENTGSIDPMYLWDISSGASSKIAQFNLNADETGTAELAFSPDGRFIVAVGTSPSHYAIEYWSVGAPAQAKRLSIPDSNNVNFSGIAFHPDGNKVLVGSADSQMRLWDLESGTLIKTYNGHAPYSIVFAAGGRRIVSGGGDAIKVWNTDTGGVLTSIFITRDGEWLEITPEGFFDASPKGGDLLSVVQGLQSYSIDQFYQALYRPDLVREKLAGDPKGLVRQAAAQLDLAKVMASGAAPEARFVSPQDGARVAQEQITAAVEITDHGGGIGRVEWRVNGVTVGAEQRGLARTEGGRLKLEHRLDLDDGDNVVEVVAYNAHDLIASTPARLTVRSEGAVRTPPRLFVMAVGVDDYYDSRLRLNYSVADAKAMAAAFQAAGQGLYPAVEVTTELDDQVKRERLDAAFADLARRVHPQDVFVFFMAGHGKTVDGHYYFLPQDFRYESEQSVVSRGISQDELQAWFAKIAAKKSVLLFDTCESGALTAEQGATRGLERVASIERLTRAMGRTVISASTDDAPALEGYQGHGVFTYSVLDGMERANRDAAGLIEVAELASYVDAEVPEISQRAFNFRQIPQMKLLGSNFPLVRPTAVLAAAPGAAAIPRKATHVIIVPTAVRETPDANAAVVTQLAPGAQITLIADANGWAIVARDGRKLGYVPDTGLAPLQ